ncbi:MAG: type III pantothenate kinase, partial [Lacipirellulaceae bacterium]
MAIDVGSSRIKLGLFRNATGCTDKPQTLLPIAAPPLAQPEEFIAVPHRDRPVKVWLSEVRTTFEKFGIDQSECEELACAVGSVHPPTLGDLQLGLKRAGVVPLQALTFDDLPLAIDVEFPEKVGIDRLLNAVAVNRLRPAHESAIVVDVGTAIKVDAVDAEGNFRGGAILPGIRLASQSLHAGTASLPEVSLEIDGSAPPSVGRNTSAAISAGLFWGAVGAIKELVLKAGEWLQDEGCGHASKVYLTGGDSRHLREYLELDGF